MCTSLDEQIFPEHPSQVFRSLDCGCSIHHLSRTKCVRVKHVVHFIPIRIPVNRMDFLVWYTSLICLWLKIGWSEGILKWPWVGDKMFLRPCNIPKSLEYFLGNMESSCLPPELLLTRCNGLSILEFDPTLAWDGPWLSNRTPFGTAIPRGRKENVGNYPRNLALRFEWTFPSSIWLQGHQ